MAESALEPTHATLEANRQRLLRELEQKLAQYETRYELKSSQVRGELAAGRLRETAEVAEWLINFQAHLALQLER